MSNESIERFNSYVPDMHGQGMGLYRACDGEYVRHSDHEVGPSKRNHSGGAQKFLEWYATQKG